VSAKDKDLPDLDQPTLWGRTLPPCLPAGRAPGLDAKGRGVWSVGAAVAQEGGALWDPYTGFAPRRRTR